MVGAKGSVHHLPEFHCRGEFQNGTVGDTRPLCGVWKFIEEMWITESGELRNALESVSC